MLRRTLICSASFGLALVGCSTQPVDATAVRRYRIVGYNDMREMLEMLCARFRVLRPDVAFDLDLKSTRSAPPALASGQSLLAPMGAPFSTQELATYRTLTGTSPLPWRVAHASLSDRALSGPLAILVHPSHPRGEISMPDVAAVFAGTGVVDGLHPVGLSPETALGSFMKERVLAGRPFAPAFDGYRQSADVVARVMRDPLAIGFAGAVRMNDAVKALALAPGDGAQAVALTPENLVLGRYPLDRPLLIYTRNPPEPDARDFLRFVLSAEGQALVGAGSLGYLPLSRSDAGDEVTRLDAT